MPNLEVVAMVKMINKVTGGYMWIHESREEEYKAAGHELAALPDSAPKKTPKKKKVVKK